MADGSKTDEPVQLIAWWDKMVGPNENIWLRRWDSFTGFDWSNDLKDRHVNGESVADLADELEARVEAHRKARYERDSAGYDVWGDRADREVVTMRKHPLAWAPTHVIAIDGDGYYQFDTMREFVPPKVTVLGMPVAELEEVFSEAE